MKIDESRWRSSFQDVWNTNISTFFDHPLSSECLCVLLFFVRCFFGRTQNCHGNSSAEKSKAKGKHHPPNAIAAQALFKGRLVFANHSPKWNQIEGLRILGKKPGQISVSWLTTGGTNLQPSAGAGLDSNMLQPRGWGNFSVFRPEISGPIFCCSCGRWFQRCYGGFFFGPTTSC